MITVLCGGSTSLRLVRGLRSILRDPEIAVVTTTADGLWMSGGHLSPTLDAAIYLFAGTLDMQRGYGMKGDSCTTHRFLGTLGQSERVMVGDRARAVQIARAGMLREGLSLTAAAEVIAGGFGITASVLPATDDAIAVMVETDRGTFPLAEFGEQEEGALDVTGAGLSYAAPPRATAKVTETIRMSDAVIIGPDPPLSGIQPILACRGMRSALAESFVIATSPFAGDNRLPWYEAAFFAAEGFAADSAGVAELYGDTPDLFVQDRRDSREVDGALALDLRCGTKAGSESLAWDLMAIVRRQGTAGRGIS
jgi:LPPG:FO 2-phospho-L-lactate transferase